MAAENTKGTTSAPDIYQYHDYRQFLRDWLAHLRAMNSVNSVRALARASGMSESYLSMVLSGDRRLSTSLLAQLCPNLGLDASAQSYLVWMHSIVEADSEEQRLTALKKIQRFHRYKELNFSEVETYAYLVNWHYVAIREMASLPDFQLDLKWIRSRLKFKIGTKQVREALNFLVQHGFIQLDANGKCKRPDKGVRAKPGVLKPALIKFHREMLNRACDSIETTPSEFRNVSAHTAAIPLEQVAEAKRILEEARAKIVALTENGGQSATEVYHFGFLAFPLTKSSGGNR